MFSAEGAGRIGNVSFHPPQSGPTDQWITEVLPSNPPAATFRDGAGRIGAAYFGTPPRQEAVEFRRITDDELLAAMDVVIGRAETSDLTALAISEEKIEEVSSEQLLHTSCRPLVALH